MLAHIVFLASLLSPKPKYRYRDHLVSHKIKRKFSRSCHTECYYRGVSYKDRESCSDTFPSGCEAILVTNREKASNGHLDDFRSKAMLSLSLKEHAGLQLQGRRHWKGFVDFVLPKDDTTTIETLPEARIYFSSTPCS